MIDTGIDFEHPDLNVVGGVNCSGGSPLKGKCTSGGDDDHYHGTHVAGTIGAIDNGIGVVGVAPGARLHAVKVLNSNGSGYTSWIVAGIDWVAANSATIEVANMSLGGSGFSQAQYDAIQGAVNKGVAFAVAAGNSDADANNYSPAAFDNVLTVSALADFDGEPGGHANLQGVCRSDQDDTLADFSNWGSAVQLAAPGVCILSTYPIEQGSYGTISGTSMASPHAAGALALLASANKPTNAAEVHNLYNQVINAGNYIWTDDSGDGIKEPLLDVSDTTIFAPATVAGTASSNNPPVANAGGSYSGTEDSAIIFSAIASDPDGDSLTYTWDFGDGNSLTTESSSVSHTYLWGSTFEVTLTVSDGKGGTATDTATATVAEVNDVPVADPGGPYSGTVGTTITFDASGSSDFDNQDGTTANDQTLTYMWDFGDGTFVDTFSTTTTHTYFTTGTRPVTLVVNDGFVDSLSVSTTVEVTEASTNTMHVGDLDGTVNIKGKSGKWEAFVTVAVHDATDNSVAGATVVGNWSTTAATWGGSGTTDSSGIVTLASGSIEGSSSVTFTVTEVTHSSLTYDGSKNHDPDGDSNGTTITISLPSNEQASNSSGDGSNSTSLASDQPAQRQTSQGTARPQSSEVRVLQEATADTSVYGNIGLSGSDRGLSRADDEFYAERVDQALADLLGEDLLGDPLLEGTL
ncbi:MAG TPA: S8 family serine peptidase [Pirellulaceae bacterium]|nr:S8 family serine peptidase [Pirellulaceae bacterium]